MSKAQKSNYQLLAKYLPYVGLFFGSISFFALVSVLPVFDQMNLFRAIFLLSIIGFFLLIIRSEVSRTVETLLTDLGILGLISVVAGWLVYMV